MGMARGPEFQVACRCTHQRTRGPSSFCPRAKGPSWPAKPWSQIADCHWQSSLVLCIRQGKVTIESFEQNSEEVDGIVRRRWHWYFSNLDHFQLELGWSSIEKMTGLRFAGLRPTTVESYRRAIRGFFDYIDENGLTFPTTYRQLDATLANYLEEMWNEEEPITYAGHLLSGLRRFCPQWKWKIPTAKHYLT